MTSLPSFSRTPRRKPGPMRDLGDLGQPDRASLRRAARPRSPGRAIARSGSNDSSPGVVDAPSQPTPRTTYSAFPLWTTWPPAAAFDVATASTTSLSVTPKTRSRSGSGTTWYSIGNPPTLETSATPGTEPSCGRTYQSWIARSRPRSSPPPSTVYQKIWPVAGGVGRQLGLAPGGQLALDPRQPLGHPPAPSARSDAVVEDHADHREADVARRPHHPHAAEPAQAQRQRVGHLVLDLARAVPLPLGEDDHLVLRQVGDRVDRRLPGGPGAERGQDQARDDDRGAVADREGDDRVDHWQDDSGRARRRGSDWPVRPGLACAEPRPRPEPLTPACETCSRSRKLCQVLRRLPEQLRFTTAAAQEDDPAGNDHRWGAPIEPRAMPVTGQIFWRSARARSSSARPSSTSAGVEESRPAPGLGPVAATRRSPRPAPK